MTGGAGRRAAARSRAAADDGGDGERQRAANKTSASKSVWSSRRRKEGEIEEQQNSIRIFGFDLKKMLLISVFSFLVIVFFIYNLITNAGEVEEQRARVVTPFPSPKLMDLPQFQGEHKESLYWGTYRPHVYLGIRARTPRSLVAGLMWIGIKDGLYHMRHVCQDSDNLSTYGWTQHNGRNFGHQVLADRGLKLETSFLKSKSEGSGYGGDWAVRIDVESEKSGPDDEMQKSGHLFFYIADEDGTVSLERDISGVGESSTVASGSRADVGDWQLHLSSKDEMELHYTGFRTPHIHNLSDLVQQNLGVQARKLDRLQLSDTLDDSSNILVFQISARVPIKVDFAYVSGTGAKSAQVEERVSSLTGASLTSHLREKKTEFDAKFQQHFNGANKLESDSALVGKAAIANILGGIGYFYGQSKISYPGGSHAKGQVNFLPYWPAELYTAVPSRPFFPRGFLWDEGFHQLLIWRWDINICLDILGHWLDLMNIDGWIPREQILGSEALSKVPEEFVLQYPTNGNPPTLFLVIRDLLNGINENKFTARETEDITSFLERAFVRLEAWFQWFSTTQSGKEKGSYFWHGRDNTTTQELNPKTLSSGLDDYPRASHANEDERHLDLRCWLLLAANCMHSITQLLKNSNKPQQEYHSIAKLLSDFKILNQMHLDRTYGAYFDFGNHTEKVRLIWKEKNIGNGYLTRELLRDVLEMPTLRLVPHVGYVSLFPLMSKIIPPESWILDRQLDLISNRSILWTDYGLRSLSKTSSLYMKRNTEHDPPYWRGTIWMNMNYMILSSLHYYSEEDGPYKERAKVIYDDLRSNLIRNVGRNYRETGFLWEQYNQKDGKGKGARLFTGWTALILLIMAEAYT